MITWSDVIYGVLCYAVGFVSGWQVLSALQERKMSKDK